MIKTVTMMKSGYNNTIHEEEGELKPLTNANSGIAETGGSPITKKYLVLLSLGLVLTGFLIGHRTNAPHSVLRMSQESMTAQLVDFKEHVAVDSKENVSTLPLLEPNQLLLDLSSINILNTDPDKELLLQSPNL